MRGLTVRLARNFYSTFKRKNVLSVGDSVSILRRVTNEDIENFSKISGDTNTLHFSDGSKKAIVHGAFLNGLVSSVIGTKLPGPECLVVSQTLNFPNKCFADETVKITVTLVEYRKIMKVDFTCEVVEEKKVVLFGDARLIWNK